ncbi:GrpB family protein [Paenibacillus popilliae]|uniref:GrpB family protein n=1 Tax=Paenibacillus popilliae TaxID=78057 RepID=A0ABY3APF9_PAEPP|nr:GrpB family protein [Paenibacillus sp. SDF0028]TQR44378.1 GrpB family protein [Paenibacillus sp. SDF0028]
MEQVIIDSYNPEWIRRYEEERDKIMEAVADIGLAVEHIGSTSVPGLSAKPVIDMMLGVRQLEDMKAKHIERLLEIGYEYVLKPDFPERLFFRRGQWRAGTEHLHVYLYNGDNWKDNIRFRNYLRMHRDAREQYMQLKHALAAQFPHDRVQYTAGKTDFIQGIINMARRENVNLD